jgi:glycosyltransferase involved in cell wall biosynthesis
MYECVIVIPTYNAGDFIFKNIEIYRQLDKDKYKVVLVDNGTTDPQSLERLEKIKNEYGFIVEKSCCGGGYEVGALYHAFMNHEAEYYFNTQDSMQLLDINFLYEKKDHIKCFSVEYLPARFLLFNQVNWLRVNFGEEIYKGLFKYYSLTSMCFLAKREVVKQMVDLGVLQPNKFPKNKEEEQIWERIMGISMMMHGHHLAPYTNMFSKTLMGR